MAKGAPLVRLDAAVTDAELQQARANLVLAKSKFDRAVDLARQNFISGQAKDEAENNYKVAQAAVALVEAKLAKTEIKAPFAGIIGLRVVSVGDYVKEGADLVNLEAIDPLKVDFRVPETFLRQVQVGQSVEVALDALPGKSYDGKVLALNPLVDAAGRAIVIRAQVKNQDAALRPGMFARVRLITRAEREALVLPEEALVPQGTEQFVFRIVDGKATRVKVETGQRRDGKVEVVSGVDKGDVIVTAGQLRLRDGAPVRVAGADAAAEGCRRQGAPAGERRPPRRVSRPRRSPDPDAATRGVPPMTLPELCIRRPVFATVLSLVILLVGLISYQRLAVREYPRIDEPVVSVSTIYRGASAEVIESQVTKVLEDSLSGIEGVELMTRRAGPSAARSTSASGCRAIPIPPRPTCATRCRGCADGCPRRSTSR